MMACARWGQPKFSRDAIGEFEFISSRFDATGGPYLPASAAFGRFVGFEVGWMMWFSTFM